MDFEFNITTEELNKRVDKDCLVEVKMLNFDSVEYSQLSETDKKVVYHLCRCAFWIDKINYQLQNKYNLDFYYFVKSKADAGDKTAQSVMKLFLAQQKM